MKPSTLAPTKTETVIAGVPRASSTWRATPGSSRVRLPRFPAVRQDRQERNPRPHLASVLFRHHARDLGEVPQVVRHPGRQQLTQRDRAQRGVLARQVELRFEMPGLQQFDVRGAKPLELTQQRFEGAAGVAGPMAKAIVWFEANARAAGQDHSRPGNPVGFLAVDQVSDVVERAERLRAFVPPRPRLGDALEERPESRGGSAKHVDCEVEAELHVVLSGQAHYRKPSVSAY